MFSDLLFILTAYDLLAGKQLFCDSYPKAEQVLLYLSSNYYITHTHEYYF